MSIKPKHRAEELVDFTGLAGNATTGAKNTYLVPYDCVLKALFARVRTAGVTGTMSIDVQKNGTTIFSTTSRIDFASGSTTPTYGTLSANPTKFTKGDIITTNVISIHSGSAAVDTAIQMVLQKPRASGIVAQMVTDTVGVEAENA